MPEFATDAEKKAYARGVKETAEKFENPPLSRKDIENMSVREIMDRKHEVDAVLRGDTTTNGDDNDD